MASQSSIAFLRRTQSSAQALASKLAAHAPRLPASSHAIPYPILPLPAATRSLTPRLVELGVDRCAATRVATAVLRSCQDLKSSLEEDFCRRGSIFQTSAPYFDDAKSASLIPAAYAAIYAKTVNDWISYIIDNFAPRLLRAISSRTRTGPETHFVGASPRRRPFNSTAIPTLEQFFGQNAFPSRLEKYELASKCNMEFRQIHVWFQNRRSRFRKEGKELKQPNRHGTLSEELENTIVDTLLPKSLTDEDFDLIEGRGVPESPNFSNILLASNPLQVTEAPAHAFPSPYPPLCPYNPFPVDSSAPAFSLPWLRSIPSSALPSATSVDVAELTTLFAKMSLSQEGHVNPPDTKASKISCGHIGFVTLCSRAPHPALIRRPRRTTRSSCFSFQFGSHRDRRESGRQIPVSGRLPPGHNRQTGSDDHSQSPQPLRPKRSLPERYPKHPPKYDLDQIFCHSSSSGHLHSRSYSSRSTASSSDIESPLATPPLLLTTLPIEIVHPSSPTSVLTFTFSDSVDVNQGSKQHTGEFLDDLSSSVPSSS